MRPGTECSTDSGQQRGLGGAVEVCDTVGNQEGGTHEESFTLTSPLGPGSGTSYGLALS